MRARGHHRRINVDHVSQYGVRRRRQEQLDWGETDEAPVRTHGTTMPLSKVDPRIPSNTAATRSSGLAMGTLRTA